MRADLINIADALEKGSVPAFGRSVLPNKSLVLFSFTYAMMHSRKGANGHQHFSSERLKRISLQFFGKRFTDTSVESTAKFHKGYYDGGAFDPSSSPGGYKVLQFTSIGSDVYKARLNSYGVEDELGKVPYVPIVILLHDVMGSNGRHLVVIGYSGEDSKQAIQPKD